MCNSEGISSVGDRNSIVNMDHMCHLSFGTFIENRIFLGRCLVTFGDVIFKTEYYKSKELTLIVNINNMY